MTPAIRLSRAVVLLGRFPALAGADLLVERGEVVHLVGPNGAGKTTILRTCAGLHAVADGQAEVLGVDLRGGGHGAGRRAVRRRVGLFGHATFLYDDLTVAENVRFALRAAGVDHVASTADDAMHRLGLDGRLRDVTVGRLSTGQRRRAALAPLVARRPELWLLDEPHAGLDASGRDLVDELVRDAVADGATVVFASHEVDAASSLGARRVTVVGGEVRAPTPAQAQAQAQVPAGA
jgi:ABC-type multidrug transport system ATPase subunit